MKIHKVIFAIILCLLVSCQKEDKLTKQEEITVTIYPLKLILQEITKDEVQINVLLGGSSSPHTYSPRPSDIKVIEKSKILLYCAENLDGWVTKLPAQNKHEIIKLIPNSMLIYISENNGEQKKHNHHHNFSEFQADPHFWSDPTIVKTIADTITKILTQYFPSKKEIFENNLHTFKEQLDSLNEHLLEVTQPIKGKTIFLFHPSIVYFLKRYGLVYGGSIEPSAGKELTPQKMRKLLDKINASGTKVIFTEPQLPSTPAKAIAEQLKVKLQEINPLGEENKDKNYFDFLSNLAKILNEALK